MGTKAHLDDERFVGCFLEVQRLEHHEQALQRVEKNRFVVLAGAADDGNECGFRVLILDECEGT